MENISKVMIKFGYSSLYPNQQDILSEISNGSNKDVIVSMKSFGGKTAAYHLAGAMQSRPVMVICSSLALIEQQTSYLNELGFRSKAITSFVLDEERSSVKNELRSGGSDIKFFFITFSMIKYAGEIAVLVQECCLNGTFAFAVIEDGIVGLEGYRENAHSIKELRKSNPAMKWVVNTTLSDRKLEQLKKLLEMTEAKIIRGDSYDREDIFYDIKNFDKTGVEFVADVKSALGKQDAITSGLVFVRTYDEANEITEMLSSNGVNAGKYHPEEDNRMDNLNDWLENDIQVLVATREAFRGGIVKIPLNFVFHVGLSDSLKSYYQESGRAFLESSVPIARIYRNGISFFSEGDIGEYAATSMCLHQVIAQKCFDKDVKPCKKNCVNCAKM